MMTPRSLCLIAFALLCAGQSARAQDVANASPSAETTENTDESGAEPGATVTAESANVPPDAADAQPAEGPDAAPGTSAPADGETPAGDESAPTPPGAAPPDAPAPIAAEPLDTGDAEASIPSATAQDLRSGAPTPNAEPSADAPAPQTSATDDSSPTAPSPADDTASTAGTPPPDREVAESAVAPATWQSTVIPYVSIGAGALFAVMGLSLFGAGVYPAALQFRAQSELADLEGQGGGAANLAEAQRLQSESYDHEKNFQQFGAPVMAAGLALTIGGLAIAGGGAYLVTMSFIEE